MPLLQDQTGNAVSVNTFPRRIVSLVPSQTELLYTLGLDEEVKGITKFCVHPAHWKSKKEIVGGTKKLRFETIEALEPDLIIANKEENLKEDILELQKRFPVWISDIKTLDDAVVMIESVASLTGKEAAAKILVDNIRTNFATLKRNTASLPITNPTAYLIWKDPFMAAGGDTFISDMMKYCGLENVFEHTPRYPVTDIDQLKQRGCRLLLLSSEPFPFKEQHVREIQARMPGIHIELVDGEMFSWYGSRLLVAAKYFESFRQLISFLR